MHATHLVVVLGSLVLDKQLQAFSNKRLLMTTTTMTFFWVRLDQVRKLCGSKGRHKRHIEWRQRKEVKEHLMNCDRALLAIASFTRSKISIIIQKTAERRTYYPGWVFSKLANWPLTPTTALLPCFLTTFFDFPPEYTSGPHLLIITGKYYTLQFKLHPRHPLRQVLKVDHLQPSAFQGHRQLMQLETVVLTH